MAIDHRRAHTGRPPAHHHAAPLPYGHVFEYESADHVAAARALSEWMLAEIAQDPDAYPAAIRDVFAEVADEAATEEAKRLHRGMRPSAGPVPLAADLGLAKERVDLAGYVAKRTGVEYRRGPGGELVARCPFPDHPDKRPSFYVNTSKGTFHCFGCGRGGDLLTFLMMWDGVTFREAVETIRWEAGLPLPEAATELAPTGTEGGGFAPAPVRGGGRRGR